MDEIDIIDIEIEACERAIRNSYCIQQVEDLANRVRDLLQKRRELEGE